MKTKLICLIVLLTATLGAKAQEAPQLQMNLDLSSLSLIGEALRTPPSASDANAVATGGQLIAEWRRTHSGDWNKIVSSGSSSYDTLIGLPVWATAADGKAFVLALIRVSTLAQIISSGDQVLTNYVSEYEQLKKLTDAVSVVRNELPPLKAQVNSLSKAQSDSIVAAVNAFSEAVK